MDLNAFNKIYSEALDALSEHRLADVHLLTDAILKDTSHAYIHDNETQELVAKYKELVRQFAEGGQKEELHSQFLDIGKQAIGHLQLARRCWLRETGTTLYGQLSSKLADLSATELADQISRTTRSHVGKPVYHEALDAAFGLAWYSDIDPSALPLISNRLHKADNFARCTIASGLMMGCLDVFSPEKLTLLLELGTTVDEDLQKASVLNDEDASQKESDASAKLEADADDLQARIAIALTLIYFHNHPFFIYYPALTRQMYEYLHSKRMRPQLPLLYHALVCQSLTNQVGKRVEDILTTVNKILEEQQPHLGTDENEEPDAAKSSKEGNTMNLSKEGKEGQGFKIQITRIDMKSNQKLFNEMMNFAQNVNTMREQDMDVNFSNFIHMKRFDFFNHFAHWFYPFTIQIDEVQKGLRRANGKIDRLTLSIMNHSRFCASDRYSYAFITAFLRKDGHPSISDQIQDQMEQMLDENNEFISEFFEDNDSETCLNPFLDYCQTCYRFMHSKPAGNEYSGIFSPDKGLAELPRLPFKPPFEDDFHDFKDIEACVSTYLEMGSHDHAITLLNHFIERNGSTAKALKQRGLAFTRSHEWQNAIRDFEQSLLIEDDDELCLLMARCYEAQQDWDRAVPLLLKENEHRNNKDANIIEEIARCLVQLRRWDDAAQRFFQLELMGEHLSVCRRGIGWCSLQQGKYQRAEKYYRMVLDNAKNKRWDDHLNLGHALWLQDHTSEAVAAYQESVTIFNRVKKAQRHEFSLWSEAFREDARILLSTRFNDIELVLMQDLITMK